MDLSKNYCDSSLSPVTEQFWNLVLPQVNEKNSNIKHCKEILLEKKAAFRAANFCCLESLLSGIKNIGGRKVFHYCSE